MGAKPLLSVPDEYSAMPICFRFDELTAFWAAIRALLSAGNRMPINRAMIEITTNNSIRVNAFLFIFCLHSQLSAVHE